MVVFFFSFYQMTTFLQKHIFFFVWKPFSPLKNKRREKQPLIYQQKGANKREIGKGKMKSMQERGKKSSTTRQLAKMEQSGAPTRSEEHKEKNMVQKAKARHNEVCSRCSPNIFKLN